MKQIILTFALVLTGLTLFGQSPRIRLNQITKDSITGSIVLSGSDSNMVYSRDFFVNFQDSVLILFGDTLSTTATAFTGVSTDLTLTGNGTSGNVLKVDTAIIATVSALADSMAGIISSVSTDITLTGDGTVGNVLKVDTTVMATLKALADSVATRGTVSSVAVSAGTGISISGSPITTSGTITVTNAAPDQTVVLTGGTGITTSGTYPNFTITNTAPDQTVSIIGAGINTVTGTYPNFTITGTEVNNGTVTGITAGTFLSGGTITSSGTIALDTASAGLKTYISENKGTVSLATGVTGTLSVANGGTGQTALTANKVMVGNGTSGVLTPTNLHWDNSQSRLGIGTSSPSTDLQIKDPSVSSGGLSLDVYGFDGAARFFTTRAESPFNTVIELHNNPASSAGSPSFTLRGRSSTTNSRVQSLIYSTWTTDTDASRTSKLVFQTTNSAITSDKVTILGNGNVGIGVTSPTAVLHLNAGTASANTAPFKFTSGTNLTTAEAGAMEWNGTNLFLTNSGATRQTINQGLTGSATLDFDNTSAQSSADLTITVTGASDGDVVSLGVPNGSVNANTSYSAWVSGANTVTVRFNNYSASSVDPASGTFKVFVTKF